MDNREKLARHLLALAYDTANEGNPWEWSEGTEAGKAVYYAEADAILALLGESPAKPEQNQPKGTP